MTVIAFQQPPSHSNQAYFRTLAGAERDEPRLHTKVYCPNDGHSVCSGSNRFKAFRMEGKQLGMEQNELFKGNVKWVYTVQRGA